MKITEVRTVLLSGPGTNDPFLREARKWRSAAFVEVLTDAGISGLGETYAGYFCPELVPAVVERFRPVLLGCGVDDIPGLWRRMYSCENYWCRAGLGSAVLTGIEAALWDLRGKLEGVPVFELLGGARHESLACYATGGPANYPLDRLEAKVNHYLSLGFTATKVGVGSFTPSEGFRVATDPAEAADFEARKLQFLRDRFGDGLGIMLDGHMGCSYASTWGVDTALAVARAIEPFHPLFLEEPLPYTDVRGYAELCRGTSVTIAGGESLSATSEWLPFVEADAFDLAQPDASFSSGLGEFMKIAALFAERGRGIATHAWGAAGCLMQNLHCAFAAPNTQILEIPPDYAGLHRDLMVEPFEMQNGRTQPPRAPGLGIRLTGELERRYPFIPGTGEFVSVPGKVLVDP